MSALSFTLRAQSATGWVPRLFAALQRAAGRAFAAVLLLLLLPVLIVVALLVRWDSPGPIVFKQQRLGRDRRPFTMYKFRTMSVGGDDREHRDYVRGMLTGRAAAQPDGMYKLADVRVTRVGRLLRRTSVDELPQLVNVLIGNMALVGPRPMLDYEVEVLPVWALRRFDVRPGITGLWQVSGRNSMDLLSAVALDVRYAEERSFAGDVRILLRTVGVLLARSAAR